MSLEPRPGMTVILASTLPAARYWKDRLADEFPDLTEAGELSIEAANYEGRQMDRCYIAPGASFTPGYDRALAAVVRNLYARPHARGQHEMPIYLPWPRRF